MTEDQFEDLRRTIEEWVDGEDGISDRDLATALSQARCRAWPGVGSVAARQRDWARFASQAPAIRHLVEDGLEAHEKSEKPNRKQRRRLPGSRPWLSLA
jgi:hypothetical protein